MARADKFNHVIYDVATGIVLFSDTNIWVVQQTRKTLQGTAHAILPFSAVDNSSPAKIESDKSVKALKASELSEEILERRRVAELRRKTFEDIQRSLGAVVQRRTPVQVVPGSSRMIKEIVEGSGPITAKEFAEAAGVSVESLQERVNTEDKATRRVHAWVLAKSIAACNIARDISDDEGREKVLNFLREAIVSMPKNKEVLKSSK